MTLDKACELMQVPSELGGGYNRNGVRMILAEVHREQDQATADRLILEFSLDTLFGIPQGTELSRFGSSAAGITVTITSCGP